MDSRWLEVQLPAGPIEYKDTGGPGPVLVFMHGLVMDGTVFDEVVRDLRVDHRCVLPTLPLGGHRRPMRPEADLTLRGLGQMMSDFLDQLDLQDVTLILNDHAAGLAVVGERTERVARLVVSSCEAFDNYPPGLPGKNIGLVARVPGGLYAAMQLMRIRALRRLPIALGWMAKRAIPSELTDAWFRPVQTQRAIRRDLAKYAGGARKHHMLQVMERLGSYQGPALVIWAKEDRVMPREHGRRMAQLLHNARLVEVADSYTLIPLDQPIEFARLVREFVAERPTSGA